MKRVLSSRKLWGALVASLFLIVIVLATPEQHLPSAIMALGGLWGAAIGGQAYVDVLSTKK